MSKKRVPEKRWRKLRRFLEICEKITDISIPFWLVVIAVLLILHNPFWALVDLDHYEPWISIIDGMIVFFFATNLVFKWFRVRHWKQFLKLYWLDIIAIFPFYLIARLWISLSTLARVGEEIGEGQRVLHEFLLFREAELIKEAHLVREAELLREMRPVMRAIRSVQRFIRFVAGEQREIRMQKRRW